MSILGLRIGNTHTSAFVCGPTPSELEPVRFENGEYLMPTLADVDAGELVVEFQAAGLAKKSPHLTVGDLLRDVQECLARSIEYVRLGYGHVLPNTPCHLPVGGSWGSDFRWFENSLQKRSHNELSCPGDWSIKDGGF